MNRILLAGGLAAIACASSAPVLAQTTVPVTATLSNGQQMQPTPTVPGFPDPSTGAFRPVRPGDPLPVAPAGVALSVNSTPSIGTSWTTITPSTGKALRRLSDATGGGCVWTARTSGQTTGEGVPFSLSGSPGTEDFGGSAPTSAISAKCASTTTLTVIEG